MAPSLSGEPPSKGPAPKLTVGFTKGIQVAPTYLHSGTRWVAVIPGSGAALSTLGVAYLVWSAPGSDGVRPVLSVVVYGFTLVLAFVCSALYHGARQPRIRRLFQTFDHSAIYLLIAGTCTPFALLPLWDHFGWLLLLMVWFLALMGMGVRLFWFRGLHRLSPLFYLTLGWLGMAWIYPLAVTLDGAVLTLLIAGGATFTFGLVFFHWQGLRFGNAVWHMFVVTGCAAHFVAVALLMDGNAAQPF